MKTKEKCNAMDDFRIKEIIHKTERENCEYSTLEIEDIFYRLFGIVPFETLHSDDDKLIQPADYATTVDTWLGSDDDDDDDDDEQPYLTPIDYYALAKMLDEKGYVQYALASNYADLFININEKIIIRFNSGLDVFHIGREIPDIARIDLPLCKSDKKAGFKVLTQSVSGYKTIDMAFDRLNSDIFANYNDDIQWDKMNEFVADKSESGLMLFHGAPGTGKSSIIKELIVRNTNRKFIFLDANILHDIVTANLVDFFIHQKNTIYIIEDAEKLLVNRKTEYNAMISTLLNMTDGLLGSALKTKFICTFNTDVSNIDKALLRKGRLKLIYEFKPLTIDKTRKLYPEAKQPMTLGDIYNAKEENDFSAKRTKIGF